jgi:hypothetical protein
MPGDRIWQSVSWPLKVIFVATFLAGLIGLLWLRIGNWTESISWILLGISLGVALLLLLPPLAEIVRRGAIVAGLDRIEKGMDSLAKGADLEAVAKQLEATGAIGAALGRVETGMGSLATGADLAAVAKQLETTGPIRTQLEAVEQKLDDRLKGVEKKLERFSTLLDERAARLRAVKDQIGAGGDIDKGLQTITADASDATKVTAGVASVQQLVNTLRSEIDAID